MPPSVANSQAAPTEAVDAQAYPPVSLYKYIASLSLVRDKNIQWVVPSPVSYVRKVRKTTIRGVLCPFPALDRWCTRAVYSHQVRSDWERLMALAKASSGTADVAAPCLVVEEQQERPSENGRFLRRYCVFGRLTERGEGECLVERLELVDRKSVV